MANETRGIAEVIPYIGVVILAFLIAGYVSFAFFNGVTTEVYPWPYDHFENRRAFVGAWLGAWVVAGAVVGTYFGRK